MIASHEQLRRIDKMLLACASCSEVMQFRLPLAAPLAASRYRQQQGNRSDNA